MKLNHITLLVSDIERSKKFYKRVFNFDVRFEKEIYGEQFSKVTGTPNLRLKFAVLQLPNTDCILELAQFISPKKEVHSDFRHIAFEVDNVDRIYKEIKERGVETISKPVTISNFHPNLDGKRFFYCKDLDGNLIELFKSQKNLYSIGIE